MNENTSSRIGVEGSKSRSFFLIYNFLVSKRHNLSSPRASLETISIWLKCVLRGDENWQSEWW